jgi:TonB family protein
MKSRIQGCACLLLAACTIASSLNAQNVKHLSKSESMALATAKTQPDYPPMARQLKVEGTVELSAYVTEEGTVEKVEVLSGNPILARPAQEALKKWKFKVVEDGKPTKAVANVSFTFKL